ncbi:MAG: ROK family protein [Candidatus Kuenenia sp.]|nr:ROK family protein [Candidatus Kuenenia hertensis]
MCGYLIGIDLGGTNLKAGIVDRGGRILHRFSIKTNADAESLVISQQICELIAEIIKNARIEKSGIIGIGLGSPGLIDKQGETILFSPNLSKWRDIPIKRIIAEKFDLPCVLENDANAAAWGEKWAGAGKNANSLVMLTLGTGIGGGIILDNKLWRGMNNVAGEIGHMSIQTDGPQCNCGNYGCIEVYASATGMVKRFRKLLESGKASLLKKDDEITAKRINEAAVQGDEAAQSIIEETGYYLGIAIVNIIHILNPEVIVLAGGMIGSGELLMNPMKRTIEKRVLKASYKDTKIVFSQLGTDAGIIGAAGCLLKELEISA